MQPYAGQLAVLVMCLVAQIAQAYWSQFELVSIMHFNHTDDAPIYDTTAVKKIDRHNYGISGDMRIKSFSHLMSQVILFHKATPNADYKPMVYKYERTCCCESMNQFYIKFVQNDLREPVSDLPQFEQPGPELCTAFDNQTFHIRKFVFDTSKIPKFFQPGYYKAVLTLHVGDNDEVVGGGEYVLRLF